MDLPERKARKGRPDLWACVESKALRESRAQKARPACLARKELPDGPEKTGTREVRVRKVIEVSREIQACRERLVCPA